jgi:hypothetical protein
LLLQVAEAAVEEEHTNHHILTLKAGMEDIVESTEATDTLP